MTIPEASPLPSTDPAIRVDRDGIAHVAVLFRREPRRLGLAEVVYPPDGSPAGDLSLRELGTLPAEPVRAGAVAFSVVPETEGRPVRREWLLLLEDGAVIRGRSAAPTRLQAPPALPLELLPLSQATYVLTVESFARAPLQPLAVVAALAWTGTCDGACARAKRRAIVPAVAT